LSPIKRFLGAGCQTGVEERTYAAEVTAFWPGTAARSLRVWAANTRPWPSFVDPGIAEAVIDADRRSDEILDLATGDGRKLQLQKKELDISYAKYIRRETMKPDRRLIFLLNVGYRRLQRSIEAQMNAQHNLTSAQSGVLFFLGRHDGALIGDVSEALDVVPSAMTGLADRMERAGLIKRKRDGADGRSQRLYITPAGRDIGKQAAAQAKAINNRLMDGFSEQEIDVVSRWLSSLQEKFPKNEDG
jgi:DNA-binding MarR family transcriptional regulator